MRPVGVRTCVQVAGLLGVLAGTVLLLVAPSEPGRTAALAALTAGAALAAVALNRRPGSRWVSRALWVLAALVLAAGTAWSAVLGGWAGCGPSVLAAGTVVAGGAVLARRARPGARSGWAAPVAGVLALALVAGVAAGTAVLLDRAAVTSTGSESPVTADGGTVPDPVAVRWRWAPGTGVRDVRAGGPGVIVLSRTEVVGLDTRTGAVRWTHRRAGVEPDGLAVSPDGRTAVVTADLADPLRDDRDLLVTVLDAATGAQRWTEPVADEPLHVTDTAVTLPAGDPDDGRVTGPLVARSPADGRPLWSAVPDPRCEFRAAPTVSAAVVLQDCPGPLGGPRRIRSVRSLDDATGATRWSSPPVPVDPRATATADLLVPADGRSVVTGQDGDAPVVLDVADGTVLARAALGARFALVGQGLLAEVVRGGAVRVLGPDGPVPVPPAVACADGARPVAFGVAGTAPVLLCGNQDGSFDVRVPARAPLPLGRLAGGVGTQPAASGWVVPVPGAVVVAASPLSEREPGPELAGLGRP